MHSKSVFIFVGLFLMPFAWLGARPRQIEIIPGSSVRGLATFEEKGCNQCHDPNSFSAGAAHTPMQLAAVLWNHAPRMWRSQQALAVRPTLDSMETADLFAYFYSIAYFRSPGNPGRGAQVFEAKRCSSCHETGPNARLKRTARPTGPPLSTWTGVNDPLAWAEAMWNHTGRVHRELSSSGVEWPRFTTGEMVDLLAYLRSLPETRSQDAAFQPGDPEKGRIKFEMSCESCHTFGSRNAAREKVDLLKRTGPDALSGYIAAMWNHAPVMQQHAGPAFPLLGRGDMNDLTAYLFSQRYFQEEGDVKRGAAVFKAKNCATCHEQRAKQIGAPDLTKSTERYSPITMSTAIWRHGPAMLERTKSENLPWPELRTAEMTDLIAYLNSRLVPLVAK